MRLTALMILTAAVTAALLPFAPTGTGHGQDSLTERVSVSTAGTEAGAASIQPGISADARYVVFASDATDLVPNDSGNMDVFVRDRQAGITERVSVASDGTAAGGPSLFPAISGDGRYVVFQSAATNLVTPDTSATDIFLRDRLAGTTTRVSVAGDGTPGNDDSETPSISADGRYVTFTSLASNLVADDGNQDRDVFVRDLVAGTTELVSLATDGTHGNFGSGGLGAGPARISAGGRYVVYGSFANNLVANDLNGDDDIFVRDRMNGTTERVSVATDETERDGHSMYGSVSDDGRYVAFFSEAQMTDDDTDSHSDVFLRDRTLGTTTRLSVGPGGTPPDGSSRFPMISADGGIIAFHSDATMFVPNDMNGASDVFVYHMVGYFIDRASVADGGAEGNGASAAASVNSDGSAVAFQSSASNLAPNDGNGVADIFARGKPAAPEATSTPTPAPPTVTPTPTSQRHLNGDVNRDGRVDSIDAAIILQYAAGLLPAEPAFGDVNHDGQTNAIDAALILQYVAGLLGQLPP